MATMLDKQTTTPTATGLKWLMNLFDGQRVPESVLQNRFREDQIVYAGVVDLPMSKSSLVTAS
jgi:hypothetical protein